MRPRRRIKRKLPFFLFILGLLIVFAGLLWWANERWLNLPVGPDKAAGQSVNSFTVLLLGTDARPGETLGRTDSIILADIDVKEKRLSLLSIPRDTRVEIPRHGTDKINAANVYGGPELTAQVVSNLVGVPVKYYALTNWTGFKDIVDTLGGISIDVEKRMYYYDSSDGSGYTIDLKPGMQTLDGNKALQYVRYRNDALGDISRTERQLKFLTALAKEAMKPDTIIRLPKLISQANECLKTNLSYKQLLALAQTANKFDQLTTVTQTLPGNFSDLNGISYWTVDLNQTRQIAKAFFEDGQVTEVVQHETVNQQVYPAKVALQGQTGTGTSSTTAGQKANTPADKSKTTGSAKKDEKTPATGEETGNPQNESGDLSNSGTDESGVNTGVDAGRQSIQSTVPQKQPTAGKNGDRVSEDTTEKSDSSGVEIILIPSNQETKEKTS